MKIMEKNYFDILDVPKKLVMDHNELKKKYFQLLKENSSDSVLNKEKKSDKDKAKRQIIETAYQTLKDRQSRIEHLLEVEGISRKDTVPMQFMSLSKQIKEILPKAKSGDSESVQRLKKLHVDILNEFSQISIELAYLEKAWDAQTDLKDSKLLLKKISRKSAAFSFVKSMEQNIRQTIN